MKIGFVNFTPMKYSVDTPYQEPLGGSESAMCYLAEALAKLGHEVILFGRNIQSFTSRGVKHQSDKSLTTGSGEKLDFMVIQNTPLCAKDIKNSLDKKTKLIFWTQHAPDQPAVACLQDKNIINMYDSFVFVSQWQMNAYLQTFDIDFQICVILQNAIAPVFENLFGNKKILSQKKKPPVLAYTSTPFRGLNVLISLFPAIRKAVLGVTLRVYSSMKVYQSSEKDEQQYDDLYKACRETEGVKYVGSLSQAKLARELKSVSVLVYPNTFPETSCIAVMEAMAAGCQIISTRLGALPETTAGYASLFSTGTNFNDYCSSFVNETVSFLDGLVPDKKFIEEKLRNQVDFVNENYLWKKRAKEWEKWLGKFLL